MSFASNPGDTILVCPGTYVGQVVIDDDDDLTIRGVDPWTARLVAAPDHPDYENLVTVDGVSGTRLSWLRLIAPAPAVGECSPVDHLIRVVESPDTRIRANNLRANGTDTHGDENCGYDYGIGVYESPGTVVAWNRIIDFQSIGIAVHTSDDVDIHDNSVHFLHADEPVGPSGTGISVVNAERTRVARNLVRALPSSGIDTPMLGDAIHFEVSSDPRIVANRVWHAGRGIFLMVVDAIVRENHVRYSNDRGLDTFETTGSRFVRNVFKGGWEGIALDSTSSGNTLLDNDARNNDQYDCIDFSSSANTWTGNLGAESVGSAVCSLP